MSTTNQTSSVYARGPLAASIAPAGASIADERSGTRRSLLLAIIWLVLVAVFVRLPYFVRAVIDWDESTFMLMANCLLEGHLPQTVLSAFKPPLAYVPYALFLGLFGPSIPAVRIGGLLCVMVASIAIYLACRRHFGPTGAFLAGVCVSIFATVDRGCGCTMLEHVALVPISLTVLCWPKNRWTVRRGFCIGLLIGLAGALKTNLAGLILAPLIMLALEIPAAGWRTIAAPAAMLLLGFSLPLLAPVPIYWLTGNLDLLWRSSVLAAFSYVSKSASDMDSHMSSIMYRLQSTNVAGFALSWIAPLIALVAAFMYRRATTEERSFLTAMTVLAAAGTLTVLSTGMLHIRHHYVVLVPVTAVISGFAFKLAFSSGKRFAFIVVACALVSISLSSLVSEYGNAWSVVGEKQQTDTAYKIADYLRQHDVQGKYAYFTTQHIGYLLTGARIPTRFVHPSDIGKPHFLAGLYRTPTDALSELHSIFDKKPVYVVSEIGDDRIRGGRFGSKRI